MNKMKMGGMTMVKKGGKMVPDFAADGKGKMAKGGLAKKGEGIAKKGFAKGGTVSGMGQSQGKTLSRPTHTTVPGDTVKVRGVGAARARTAKIY
jgi:hypothetical protein